MKMSMLVPGVIVVLASSCHAPAEDASSEVKAAFARLAEAPNHSFQLHTETVPAMPQGVGEITGKTEKNGWTQLQQKTPNGTFDFVFQKRKGVLLMPDGWNTVADLNTRTPRERSRTRGDSPMRKEFSMLTSRKLPADMAAEIVGHISSFKREGDAYTAQLSQEEVGKMLGADRNKGVVIPAGIQVNVRLENGYPATMEMQQRFEEGGRTQGFNVTYRFSDIGKTKLEVPEEARKRLAQPSSSRPDTKAPVTAGELSRAEALELAKKVEGRLVGIKAMLFVYAAGNNFQMPQGKTANEVFRVLFQTGICEDEQYFAIPDGRARASRKLPDGDIGSGDDGFAKAMEPGECDVIFIALPPDTVGMGPPGRPTLRCDIKAADGAIVVVVIYANGDTRIVETRDGVVHGEGDQEKMDIFSAAAGVEPGHILRPAPAGP